MKRRHLSGSLIPKPVFVKQGQGLFSLTPETKIFAHPGMPGAEEVALYLAAILQPAVGTLEVLSSAQPPAPGHIYLAEAELGEGLGEEGYRLESTPTSVLVAAPRKAGLFYGVQTLRQLLPAQVESGQGQGGPWQIPAVTIKDYPRFAWRGAMLDVARNFFPVSEVKRLMDLLAAYKLNRLHLHLSDDQGWRIMINKWPKLATHGGKGAVKGGRFGFYTQAEYKEIVAYAQSRLITIVPEIDLPGHTNAALASYPGLNRTGEAPPLYDGIKVGFSSLAVEKEITYQFVADVLSELAALTPGPYLHVGGDEALSTTKEEYTKFMSRLQPIVADLKKTMVGWGEISQVPLDDNSIVQLWRKRKDDDGAAAQDAPVIMSPAHHAYLDMKYTESTPLGLDWAGLIEVRDAYNWEPSKINAAIAPENILGVEAPLWTETIRTMADLEYMFFPRVLGHAEIAWSPQERNWEEYRDRLAAHGPRLDVKGINFYPSPQVNWD